MTIKTSRGARRQSVGLRLKQRHRTEGAKEPRPPSWHRCQSLLLGVLGSLAARREGCEKTRSWRTATKKPEPAGWRARVASNRPAVKQATRGQALKPVRV